MKYSGIVFLFISISSTLFSQDEFKIDLGIGFPELLNTGINYQIQQTQFEISAGTWPNENIFSLMLELKQHFAGNSKFSESKLWYFLIGLSYLYEDSRTKIFKYLHCGLRLGGKIYFSRKAGIDMNAGFSAKISDYTIIKKPQNGPIGSIDIPIYPNICVKMFYVL